VSERDTIKCIQWKIASHTYTVYIHKTPKCGVGAQFLKISGVKSQPFWSRVTHGNSTKHESQGS